MNELILDRCLEDIRAGRATVTDCLTEYPDQADELKPLLEMALTLQVVPDVQPTVAFKQSTRARLLNLQPPAKTASQHRINLLPFSRTLRFTSAALAIVVFLAALTGGIAYAASDSLPGSALYPFKRTIEQIELAIANDPASQARVHISFADHRLNEIIALSKAGHNQAINQTLIEYGNEVNAVVAAIRSQPSQESTPTRKLLIDTLTRHQQELHVIYVPVGAEKTVQDALDVSQKALEQLSPAPLPTPAPVTLPTKPAPTSTPIASVVAPPSATQTATPLPTQPIEVPTVSSPAPSSALPAPTVSKPLPSPALLPPAPTLRPALPGPTLSLPLPTIRLP